jgi:hypothetical protein
MTSEESRLLTCPCCGGELLFEPVTGALKVVTPPAGGAAQAGKADGPATLEDIQARMAAREKGRKDAFGDALKAERDRGTELDALFREASEKVDATEDDDEAPDNPMDERWR